MTRSSIGLALTILTAALVGQSARGQNVVPPAPAGPPVLVLAAPMPATSPAGPGGNAADYNPLPDLPRPLDAPRTLLLPAPAAPTAQCVPSPGPYFENDPLYNDPALPQPGWYTAVEVDGVIPHIKENITGLVTIGGNTFQVTPPNAPLDWTVAPSFTLGYRLPSGFGEFALSYRGFSSKGTEAFTATDGPGGLTSRLDLNQMDFDYLNREYSLFPNWDMTWHIGLRVSTVYYDSTIQENFADAAAGSGIFQAHGSNSYWGIGPNAGLSLARHIDGTYLSVLTRVDATNLIGRVNQHFNLTSTTMDASGQYESADSRYTGTQSVPVVNFQVGINWNPPQMPHSNIFLGYVYEYWWDIGRLDNSLGSLGEMSNQGITFRAEFNY